MTFCTLMHEYNKSNFVLIYLFSLVTLFDQLPASCSVVVVMVTRYSTARGDTV